MYYIYRITNNINGKTYIGQHKYKKLNDSYMGSGILLHRAYKRYGIENFKKEILVFNVLERKYADLLEKTFIASERENGKAEYNIANGGQGGNLGGEVNRKISESLKGKPSGMKGKHFSEESKRNMSKALKGHSVSEEARKKISENNKGKHYMHHSEETKKKISEASKGRKLGPMSDEAKKMLSEAKKGRHWFNNGKTSVCRFECPDGFIPGRI